ncbi:MAG: hypothetical protein IPL61_01350 [Myxococcales bacterium]|nr:hypothetical protein [Myxococcales bacterium]
MRASLSFLTSTTITGDDRASAPAPQTLEVLGYDHAGQRVFARERIGDRVTSLVVIATRGEHTGTPMALAPDALPRMRVELTPLIPVASAGFELTTRVIQRRGLRISSDASPIRKFALAVGVRQHVGGIPVGVGRQVVTAYLRPRATLRQTWALPGDAGAVVIVTFCGTPIGVGADRDAAILVAPPMH